MKAESKLIKSKLGLLHLAEHLGNVSQACKVIGYSRDSFYRIKELYDTGGEAALKKIFHNPSGVEIANQLQVCQEVVA